MNIKVPLTLATALLAGAVQLTTDLGGTALSPTVVQLTGTGGLVTVPSATNVKFAGATTTATAGGRLLFPNNVAMVAFRNQADGANIVALTTDTSDRVILNGTGVLLQVGASTTVTLAATTVTLASSVGIVIGTSGYIQGPGSNPATTGLVRVPNATTAVFARNQANSADVALLHLNSSNRIVVGLAGNAPGGVQFDNSTVTGAALFDGSGMHLYENLSMRVELVARAGDSAATDLFVRGSSAASGASTNINGTFVNVQGGAKAASGSAVRGGVRLQLNAAAETMVEVTEPAVGRRIVALCRNANLTTTEMPTNTGDLVIYIGNAATAPTAAPVSGGILYCSAGALRYRGSGNTDVQVAAA